MWVGLFQRTSTSNRKRSLEPRVDSFIHFGWRERKYVWNNTYIHTYLKVKKKTFFEKNAKRKVCGLCGSNTRPSDIDRMIEVWLQSDALPTELNPLTNYASPISYTILCSPANWRPVPCSGHLGYCVTEVTTFLCYISGDHNSNVKVSILLILKLALRLTHANLWLETFSSWGPQSVSVGKNHLFHQLYRREICTLRTILVKHLSLSQSIWTVCPAQAFVYWLCREDSHLAIQTWDHSVLKEHPASSSCTVGNR